MGSFQSLFSYIKDMKWDSKINYIDDNLFKNIHPGTAKKIKNFWLGLDTYDINVKCDGSYMGAYIKDRYGLLSFAANNTNTFILKNIYAGGLGRYHKFMEKAGGDLSDFKSFSYMEYLMNKKEVYFIAFEICPEVYSYASNKSFFLILNPFNSKDLLKLIILSKNASAPIPSEA